MDIQALRIFARVAALQNLSAVGIELGLTPGTISKRLQALEDDLKARLFDRTTRSIRITQEGHKFLEYTERILAEVEQARASVGASVERPAGKLTISAPAVLSHRIVVPALVSFVEAYPDIEVRVDITDRLANLQEEGYDAAIRAGVLTDSALIAKRLATDTLVLVAARAYLAQQPVPVTPSDLAAHNCLVVGDQRSWGFVRGREQTSVKVAGRLQSDNGEFLHRAALAGAGIFRTSEIAVSEDLAAGRLVRVLPDYDVAGSAAVWAVYPSAKHVLPRLRVFLDHVADFCRTGLAGSAEVLSMPVPVHANADRPMAYESGPTVNSPMPGYLHETPSPFRASRS
jgi:DNA-binding transcriptional LysR family regulator